ncbi:hypothetical protein [Prescottella subtropica]|uniref:hypothetical protein n=1 Tax=Prescottella subtropica TaxID=2545757 RepID=UPI0010F6A2EA|nr:hypothetical protein [Prescottella subtropica]
MESNEIEKSIGRRYTYPGYAEAGTAGIGVLGGAIPLHPRTGSIGTMPMKLVVQQESPDFIDAVVCSDLTRATNLRDGLYPLPPSGATFALASYRLIAQRGPRATPLSDAPSVNVLQPQPSHDLIGPVGRAAAPTTDVFKGWTLTEFTMSASPEVRDPCLAWAEQRWGGTNPPAPTRTEVEPPVIEPFYPGW